MIGGHVVENIEKVWVLADLSFDTCLPIGPVLYSLLETALVSWHQGLKIHEIFSESTSLVKAAKVDNASYNHSVLLDTKNTLLLELLNRIDDTKCHGNRQCWGHCDGDEIQELDD